MLIPLKILRIRNIWTIYESGEFEGWSITRIEQILTDCFFNIRLHKTCVRALKTYFHTTLKMCHRKKIYQLQEKKIKVAITDHTEELSYWIGGRVSTSSGMDWKKSRDARLCIGCSWTWTRTLGPRPTKRGSKQSRPLSGLSRWRRAPTNWGRPCQDPCPLGGPDLRHMTHGHKD